MRGSCVLDIPRVGCSTAVGHRVGASFQVPEATIALIAQELMISLRREHGIYVSRLPVSLNES